VRVRRGVSAERMKNMMRILALSVACLTTAQAATAVTTGSVNLRRSPGVSGRVLSVVPKGTLLIVACRGQWCRTTGGRAGRVRVACPDAARECQCAAGGPGRGVLPVVRGGEGGGACAAASGRAGVPDDAGPEPQRAGVRARRVNEGT